MSSMGQSLISKSQNKLRLTGWLLVVLMTWPCAQSRAASLSKLSADSPTRFENFHDWAISASSVDSWTQQKNCSLADDAPITDPEKSGKFQNTSHSVLTSLTAGKERLNRIRIRAPQECTDAAMHSKFMTGALAALGGQTYINNLSGMARGDTGGPFSLQAEERQACRLKDNLERQCCLKGFLAAIPELNAHINEIPDPDPAKFPERKSCREAYDFGRMQAKFSCTFNDQCFMPVEACIPIRHLGCFHLGYTSLFASDECEGNPYRDPESTRQLNALIENGVVSERLPKDPGTQESNLDLPSLENGVRESNPGKTGGAQ